MKNINTNHIIWTEKYRPTCIDDCILPDTIKNIFKGIAQSKVVPNLLLSGTAGSGKTTIAKALCEELDCDLLFINASKERGIDVVRNDISNFASTISLNSGRKVIILDEADNLTHDAQNSLKSFIEEFSSNCAFIFTCNHKNKIIPPLHSRCSCIDFKISNKDVPSIQKQLFVRIFEILDNENVEYQKEAIAGVIKKYFPDHRRVLHELQSYSKINGCINEGILSVSNEIDFEVLYPLLKGKKFPKVQEWVILNLDQDPQMMLNRLYYRMKDFLDPKSIPRCVVLLNEAQFQLCFVANPEICIMSFMTNLMLECNFN